MENKFFWFFLIFGILLYGLPAINTPLHSDVVWYFRLQNLTNSDTILNITEGMKLIGSAPTDLYHSITNWHQVTGRINFIDILTIRIMAFLFGDNANLWRLTFILLLSSSVFFCYKTLRQLNIPLGLALLSTIGLFYIPLSAWSNYQTAEPKAIFFAMIAFYFASQKRLVVSSISMLFSVLSKETFGPLYLMIPTIYLTNTNHNLRDLLKQKQLFYHFLPLALSLAILIVVITFFKLFYPVLNNDYIAQNRVTTYQFIPYLVQNIPSTLPALFSGFWLLLSLFTLINLFLLKNSAIILSQILKYFFQSKIILFCLGLSISIFLSFEIYFITGRNMSGHYVIPTNFLMVFLFAVLLTPFYNLIYKQLFITKFWQFWGILWILLLFPIRDLFYSYFSFLILFFITILLISLKLTAHLREIITVFTIILILSLPYFDMLINYQVRDYIDQKTWSQLNQEIIQKAPLDSQAILHFEEPLMIETAQSIEANAFFNNRSDITFYLKIKDPTNYNKDNGYTRFLVNTFNKGKIPLSNNQADIIIQADRKRRFPAVINQNDSFADFITLLSDPKKLFYNRYQKNKAPYLNYSITVQSK